MLLYPTRAQISCLKFSGLKLHITVEFDVSYYKGNEMLVVYVVVHPRRLEYMLQDYDVDQLRHPRVITCTLFQVSGIPFKTAPHRLRSQ